jgi:predicted phosphohydrolase
MLIIGDVHRQFDLWQELLREHADASGSLQLGDMGVFSSADAKAVCQMPTIHKFIRGNHDNPQACLSLPHYLGDFGFVPECSLFFISGGMSVDRHFRTVGVDWWEDEELSYDALGNAAAAFISSRPRLVVSHEAPVVVMRHIMGCWARPSRTATALQSMWEAHHPDLWVFGHWHRYVDIQLLDTRFIGLADLRPHGKVDEMTLCVRDLCWPDEA